MNKMPKILFVVWVIAMIFVIYTNANATAIPTQPGQSQSYAERRITDTKNLNKLLQTAIEDHIRYQKHILKDMRQINKHYATFRDDPLIKNKAAFLESLQTGMVKLSDKFHSILEEENSKRELIQRNLAFLKQQEDFKPEPDLLVTPTKKPVEVEEEIAAAPPRADGLPQNAMVEVTLQELQDRPEKYAGQTIAVYGWLRAPRAERDKTFTFFTFGKGDLEIILIVKMKVVGLQGEIYGKPFLLIGDFHPGTTPFAIVEQLVGAEASIVARSLSIDWDTYNKAIKGR